MATVIPNFTRKFFCIVHHDAPVLAALISSYFNYPDEYLLMFELPLVTAGKTEANQDEFNVHYISKVRTQELNIRLHNILKMVNGCEYLILAGLDENQKSYLDFLDKYSVIEVSDSNDVELALSAISDKVNSIECNEEDIHRGLFAAVRSGCFLKINPNASDIENIPERKSGVIVIEKSGYSSSIIAVNYALAVGADVEIIPMPKASRKEIRILIEKWQKEKDDRFVNDLGALLYPYVEYIDFRKYAYATFLTEGLPYSLVLKNVIPFSYIHTFLQPDLFIFNCLNAEKIFSITSAVVFSPSKFDVEETEFVVKTLKTKRYYVRELIGENATVFNIEYHVKEFPYSVLHLCSHGGQVDGYSVIHEFKDRDGAIHKVEYDEVVSFAPDRSEELIGVRLKYIWRTFDGYDWLSSELESKGYPHHVFVDMMKSVSEEHKKKKIPKKNITDSCAIICNDFHYQAMFNMIAGMHTNPFVFNNTCWSWSGIAESFLNAGAIGYIGTLWAVDNQIAKETAERFYSMAFTKPIIDSLHEACVVSKGTPSENIYIFWGLHFTKLTLGISVVESRYKVMTKILTSHSQWKKQITTVGIKETKDEIQRLIRWDLNQIKSFFFKEWLDHTA